MQAMGQPTAPQDAQHLNPPWQSPSTAQLSPAVPLPRTHESDSAGAVPATSAAHRLEYDLPSQPQVGAHAPLQKSGRRQTPWLGSPQVPGANWQKFPGSQPLPASESQGPPAPSPPP